MKRLTVLIVVLCVLVMSVSPGMTWAEDPEEDTPTELPAFGLTVSPGCEKILLSWQTCIDVSTYVVMRDDVVVATFYSGETTWVDKDPSTKLHNYQIIARDNRRKEIAKSWEITARTACFNPDDCKTELKYRLNSTDYWVNGSQKGPMDTPPEISFGRMFLVIKYVTQELAAELSWEGTEKKITITTATGKVIDLWIGRPIAMVDGVSVAIDSSDMKVVPYIKAGRTLLPMRFVAEQLGASGDDDVVWNDETKTVTLKVFDPACPEPDVFCLTVVDIDSTKWLVHCIDSARNSVEVLLNQEYSKFSATLKPGELILVAGKPERKSKDTIEINARWIKLLDSDLEEIKCFPTKVEEGTLTYQVKSTQGENTKEEYKTESLGYNTSFTEIESSENQYWVKIYKKKDSDNILWWKPIIYSATGEDVEEFSHSVSVEEIDTSNNRIKVSFDDGSETYNDWIYFPVGFDLTNIDQTSCQKITFHKNYVGIRIAQPEIEKWSCTVPFKLSTQTNSLLVYPEASFVYEFRVQNLSEDTIKFQTQTLVKDALGERVVKSKPYSIKSRYSSSVTAKFSAPDMVGDFRVGLRVKSGASSRTIWSTIRCEPVDFELSKTDMATEFHLNEPVYVSYKISNKFDCPLKVQPTWKLSDYILEIPKNWHEFELQPNSTKEVMFSTFWKKSAEAGVIIQLELGAKVGNFKKITTINLTALDYIPPEIVVSSIENNEDKTTTIYGSVNWNRLTRDKIVIDWGDGSTSEEKRFPFEHRYDSWDNYHITITAHSEEGSIDTYSEPYECKEPPPLPPVITRIKIKSMEKEYTIRFSVDVNWRDFILGNIVVSWGDGEVTETFRSELEHTYPENTMFATYYMTIKAVTRDGIESKERKFSILMTAMGFWIREL